MTITPERMIDELQCVYGRHEGCRVLHAKGTLCKGHFTATPAARELTTAPHMQGERIEATVRFSNGRGIPDAADAERDVRGLAVKLYLPDGGRTDLVAQTAPRTPTRTPDEFIELVKRSELTPANAVRLPLYLARHPRMIPALPSVLASADAPASYATARYFPLHAYRWIDADGGERFVRYEFVPEAGAVKAGRGDKTGRDYLQEELRQRLSASAIRFALEIQIAGPDDDPHDPTSVWGSACERVNVGALDVTGLDTERESGDDVVVFDPSRVCDGIELSDDPILQFRSRAYSESVRRRSGIARPADYR